MEFTLEAQAQTLANLTGWNIAEIRKRMGINRWCTLLGSSKSSSLLLHLCGSLRFKVGIS